MSDGIVSLTSLEKINVISSYGFTSENIDGGPKTDNNGLVNVCIFGFNYKKQVNDVDFKISSGTGHWSAKMGNGDIIPLSNPKVLYQNKDNSIVQFTMGEYYPSNSPCLLVKGDGASISIMERDEDRSFETNSVTGYFAFTTDGYGGETDEDGNVSKLVISFNLNLQNNLTKFEITDGIDDWGARMGDGTIINLYNPQIISDRPEVAVVVFDMAKHYPSNSPCVLVYRREEAKITITVIDEYDFIEATDIIDIPEVVVSGTPFELNKATFIPTDASKKAISWSVVSGSAAISSNVLHPSGVGPIVLKGVIKEAVDKGNADFEKQFSIESVINNITINAHPLDHVNLIYGEIDQEIFVVATAYTELSYQWYRNTTKTYSGAVPINSATDSKYKIPTNLTKGHYYYFCEISADGATTVRSDISDVYVHIRLTSVAITNKIDSIDQIQRYHKLGMVYTPNNADIPDVIWESNHPEYLNVGSVTPDLVIDGRTGETIPNNTANWDTISENRVLDSVGAKVLYLCYDSNGNTVRKIYTVSSINATNGNITYQTNPSYIKTVNINNGDVIPANTDQWNITVSNVGSYILVIDKDNCHILYKITKIVNKTIYYDYGTEIDPDDNHAIIDPSGKLTVIENITNINSWNEDEKLIKTGDRTYALIKITARSADQNNVEVFSDSFEIKVPVYISVTDIINLPTEIGECGTINLNNAVVRPSNAEYSTIKWELLDYLDIVGASLANNAITIKGTNGKSINADKHQGYVHFRGTIENGTSLHQNYVKEFTIPVTKTFVPVTSFTVPNYTVEEGGTVNLNATIVPSNASVQSVIYTITDAKGTASRINGNVFYGEGSGVLTLTATIKGAKGSTGNSDMTTNFTITVKKDTTVPVESIELDFTDYPETEVPALTVDTAGSVPRTVTSWTAITGDSTNVPKVGDKVLSRNIDTGDKFSVYTVTLVSGDSVVYSSNVVTESMSDGFLTKLDNSGAVIYNSTAFNQFSHMNGNTPVALEIPFKVYPENATKKDITAVSLKVQSGVTPFKINSADDTVYYPLDDFSLEIVPTVVNGKTKFTIKCNSSLLDHNATYYATMDVTIKDGLGTGKDYTSSLSFTVIGNEMKGFVPITNISLRLPNDEFSASGAFVKNNLDQLRTHVPILMSRAVPTPSNATEANEYTHALKSDVGWLWERTGANLAVDGANCVIYNPQLMTLVLPTLPSDAIDFSLNSLYLFPWRKGKVKLTATVPNGDTNDPDNLFNLDDLKDYVQTWELEFKDPFIPVKDITGIPASIPVIVSVNLSPELLTNGGLNFYNPMWDDEVPSYTDVTWSIVGTNTANAVLDGNSIKATTKGEFTLRATVVNGTQEYLNWYGNIQQPVNFTKDFKINVVDKANNLTTTLCTLTLDNGSIVTINNVDDLKLLCTSGPSSEEITIGATKFRKSDVISIKLWDDPKTGEAAIPVNSLKNFAMNFTSLVYLNRIPSSITGESCLENFLRGCTSFNQDIEIPATVTGKNCCKYFLRDATRFNSSVTIGANVTGDGCLHGFLYGCTTFNKPITIPSKVTGESCLERFLYGCSEFNQSISIPSGVTGKRSLFEFMAECYKFNKNLVLPDINSEWMINSMLKNCNSMQSTITCNTLTNHYNSEDSTDIGNEQTFSTTYDDVALKDTGVTLTGTCAAELAEILYNMTGCPYRNIIVQ